MPNGAGVLPIQDIRVLRDTGAIDATAPISELQFQPSSMDLRLGKTAYRIRSSFLPQGVSVKTRLADLLMYELDLTAGAILEKNNVYLIPLMERLKLPADIRGRCNPKSSTGRLDIFTRAITDNSTRFEDVEAGYSGQLYLEVVPRSFTVRVHSGLTLNQIRFFRGETTVGDAELESIYRLQPLLYGDDGKPVALDRPRIKDGLYMSVDIHPDRERVVGFKAKKNSTVLDLTRVDHYDAVDFWEPIYSPHENFLILEPEEFYIFASKERVRVPTAFAAEMAEFDAGSGELRTHYAGFFDAGFGFEDGSVLGTKAVLEVRPHDVPFRIEDGQIFFKLKYERMGQTPLTSYGAAIGSHYHNQSLRLSKQFKHQPQ